AGDDRRQSLEGPTGPDVGRGRGLFVAAAHAVHATLDRRLVPGLGVGPPLAPGVLPLTAGDVERHERGVVDQVEGDRPLRELALPAIEHAFADVDLALASIGVLVARIDVSVAVRDRGLRVAIA